jgi:hypothetical protein
MDIQFIQFNDASTITQVEEIPDLVPRTLRVHGIDFRNTEEVLINEETSPSFVIASKNIILAQVPDANIRKTIRTVSVISADFTATVQSRIRFRFGVDPKKVTGLKAMMQTFLKILLTSPGTDAFAKTIGGHALQNIGRSFSSSDSSRVVSDFAIAVGRTSDQMRSLQSRQSRLPDDERLLAANLINSRFDVSLTALIARVELIAQSGKRAIANLEL